MAATIIHGHRGYVDWGGSEITEPLSSWDLTINCDMHDVTQMHTSNAAKNKLAGLKSWTATCEGAADDSGPHATEGDTGVLKLALSNTASDGHFDGTAFLTGYSVTQSPDDAGRIVYNFQGSGAIAWATAGF